MTTFTWTDPTKNIDGTPVAAGEITSFNIGVRLTSVGAAGTYTTIFKGVPNGITSDTLAALDPAGLPPGDYSAAIQAVASSQTSAWSNEGTFTILAPTPVAPTGFTAA